MKRSWLAVIFGCYGLVLAACAGELAGLKGTEGNACSSGGTCNDGLRCVGGVCVGQTAGDAGTSTVKGDSKTGTSDGTTIGSDSGAGTADAKVVPTEHFSFFVTSLRALQTLSNNQNGFGGDLRFGETGAGAGLRGADKICATIAETSMAGAKNKGWRAFLSAVAGEDGKQVNAIDRIGNGPWYDRLGRLFAQDKAALLSTRPVGADEAIRDDFPNEDGVPNHQPDPTQPKVDNHDMLTGTNTQGTLYSPTATCSDWTSSTASSGSRPRVGHSWPRGIGGGPGGISDMDNWMSALDEAGCAAGINLLETGGPNPRDGTVGSGGGYGGFYCFALTP